MACMNTLQMTKTRSYFDDESNASEVSAHGSGNLDEEPHNSDVIEVWGLVNQYLFSVLRLTTTGVKRNVLLNFESKTVSQETVVESGFPYKTSIRILLASLGRYFCGG